MVNSGSFDSADGNRNGKSRCTQAGDAALGSQSSDADDDGSKSGCSKSADGDLPSDESAIEPTPTKTEINSSMPDATQKSEFPANAGKATACTSLPLEKIASNNSSPDSSEEKAKQTRKRLCLYCDRSFVSANLRQKHVERVHSVKSTRRVSARRQNQLSTTPCVHCDKLNASEHTLNDLFQHLVQEHPSKYFGCLSCEERFLTSVNLADHNRLKHFIEETTVKVNLPTASRIDDASEVSSSADDSKVTRSKVRSKAEEPLDVEENSSIAKRKKKSKLKDLRNKKISVKTSKIAIKRSKRLQQQAKDHELQKKRREKKLPSAIKPETISNTKQPEKLKVTCMNPYPEFDNFYRVKKITDHSIDNLKISSLTFDDVFDKAFFNRIKCNIEENLLHHIDGKLFKNEESESRISNFEKISTSTQEVQSSSADSYGCEISLNAITPAPSLSLNSQFGEDFEAQIEYGAKPSKKKTQIKSDEVHYKYFTRRKYQASILQQKENRDLSKLDMWTQMVVKERQQRVVNKKKSAKEYQEYTSGPEYKSKIKREELNRILDRRGPFEDLKEEASKKAAFDKLNSSSNCDISQEVFTDVREVLNELLNRVFDSVEEDDGPLEESFKEVDQREIPSFLDLRRKTSSTQEEMDKSDRIALICSSQETENFELPTNTVRGKNELVELTGEWARSRMYICAACGGKFSNMKYLLEHKSLYHQNVWVQHYEFVGNQGELYRHLSIPGLGKVGIVEDTVPCKLWKRSEARTCTKCGKRCNSLGELHRHVLECGGDWTWMLARKKCRYKPFGAKSRRKRRGFEPRIQNRRKTEPSEKKIYKKPIDGPRQRPSDADTIQRMLANLPAKRSRRSIMSLTDVVFKSRKTNNRTSTQTLPATKVKCGKPIHNKQQTDPSKSNSNQQRTSRALRSFTKVLSSRILDINSSLLVKRKMKVLRSQRLRNMQQSKNDDAKITPKEISAKENSNEADSAPPQTQKKRKSSKKDPTNSDKSESIPGNSSSTKNKSVAKRMLSNRLNLKNFFPVKKKNVRSVQKNSGLDKVRADENIFDNEASISSDEKSKYLENFQHMKKNKRGGLKGFVRALSLRKRNSKQEDEEECPVVTITKSSSLKDDQASMKSDSSKKSTRSKKQTLLPRKTKQDNTQQESVNEDANLEAVSKKRKLQRSFRNVLNKVKKVKTEKSSSKSADNTHVKNAKKENQTQPFLEDTPSQKDSTPLVKVVTLAEVKENIQGNEEHAPTVASLTDSKENPPIPETIFNLVNDEEKSLQAKGELDFDNKQTDTAVDSSILPVILDKVDSNTSPVSLDLDSKTTPVVIDTSLKPKSVPLISPTIKGKIRKPSRGLNDCIAMLTSKLQQKEEKMSSSLESLFSTSSTTSAELRTESRPMLDSITVPIKHSKPESIPRLPTLNVSDPPVLEETALDLSKKSFSTPNLVFPNSHDVAVSEDIFTTKDKDVLNDKLLATTWTSVDDIIQQVVQNSASYVFNKPKKNLFTGRTHVDDTIDFVINSSLDWFESKLSNVEEKLKHNKRARRKKHSDDNLITNIIFGKDKLIIAPSSNPKDDFEDPLIAKIKENEYKMSRSLNSSSANSQLTVKKVSPASDILETPLDSHIDQSVPDKMVIDNTEQQVENQTDKDSMIEENNTSPIVPVKVSEVESQQQVESEAILKSPAEIEVNQSEIAVLKKNLQENAQHKKETIPLDKDKSNAKENALNDEENKKLSENKSTTVESESAKQNMEEKITPKKSTRGRKPKAKKVKSQNTRSEKLVIETNLDEHMHFKEVPNDEPDTKTLNVAEGVNSTQKKIELSTENEPIVLENKSIEQTVKLPSDSEDEVPLAIIAKQDEGFSFQQRLKSSDKTLLVTDNEKNTSKHKKGEEIEEIPCVPSPLLPESFKNDIQMSDAKDMAETLTTDSLKENVEEIANKSNMLLNKASELALGHVKIASIVKTVRRKKRKKLIFNNYNRKRISNKKNPTIGLDASMESKANPHASPYSATPEESELSSLNSVASTLTEHNTFTFMKADLPVNEQSNISLPETSNELTSSSESSKLKTIHSENVDSKTSVKLENSQRTRRKSKSSKKLDKIDNDLFKDFSLVINKKTKRIPPTSIVDDSVCDDILDANINFFIKPLEVTKEADVINMDVNNDTTLNDSVEEMDMEIEDIPINTSIIERDDKQLATLTSYKGELSFVSEDDAQNLVPAEDREPPVTRKSPRKKNASDLDSLESSDSTDVIKTELTRVVSKRGRKPKKYILEQNTPTDITCNIQVSSKPLSLDNINSEPSESKKEQEELLAGNAELEKNVKELTGIVNSEDIQNSQESSFIKPENCSSLNFIDMPDSCVDTSVDKLPAEIVVKKRRGSKRKVLPSINSSETDGQCQQPENTVSDFKNMKNQEPCNSTETSLQADSENNEKSGPEAFETKQFEEITSKGDDTSLLDKPTYKKRINKVKTRQNIRENDISNELPSDDKLDSKIQSLNNGVSTFHTNSELTNVPFFSDKEVDDNPGLKEVNILKEPQEKILHEQSNKETQGQLKEPNADMTSSIINVPEDQNECVVTSSSHTATDFETPLQAPTRKKITLRKSRNKKFSEINTEMNAYNSAAQDKNALDSVPNDQTMTDYLSSSSEFTEEPTCSASPKTRKSRRSKAKDEFKNASLSDTSTGSKEKSCNQMADLNLPHDGIENTRMADESKVENVSILEPASVISRKGISRRYQKREKKPLFNVTSPEVESVKANVTSTDLTDTKHETEDQQNVDNLTIPHSADKSIVKPESERSRRKNKNTISDLQKPENESLSSEIQLEDNILKMTDNNISVNGEIVQETRRKTRSLAKSDEEGIVPYEIPTVKQNDKTSLSSEKSTIQFGTEGNVDILTQETNTDVTDSNDRASPFEKPLLTYPRKKSVSPRKKCVLEDKDLSVKSKQESYMTKSEDSDFKPISATPENTDSTSHENMPVLDPNDTMSINLNTIERLSEDSSFVERLAKETVEKKGKRSKINNKRKNSKEYTNSTVPIIDKEICVNQPLSSTDDYLTDNKSALTIEHSSEEKVIQFQTCLVPVDSDVGTKSDTVYAKQSVDDSTCDSSKNSNSPTLMNNDEKLPSAKSRSKSVKNKKRLKVYENVTSDIENTQTPLESARVQSGRKKIKSVRNKKVNKATGVKNISENNAIETGSFLLNDLGNSAESIPATLLPDSGNKQPNNQEVIETIVNNETVEDFRLEGNPELKNKRKRSGRSKSGITSAERPKEKLEQTVTATPMHTTKVYSPEDINMTTKGSDVLNSLEVSTFEDSNISENMNTFADETATKSRRPRKIIDYNEDNLEKRALELNKTATQDQKLNKNIVSQINRAKKSKKNASNSDDVVDENNIIELEEFVVNEGTSDISTKDVNKELISDDVRHEDPVDIHVETENKEIIEVGPSDLSPEEVNTDIKQDHIVVSGTRRKKKNKQRMMQVTKDNLNVPQTEKSVIEDNIQDVDGKEIGYELSLDTGMETMVYKIAEFSEIPKLVVDIHHVDQIDQQLKENVVNRNIGKSSLMTQSTDPVFKMQTEEVSQNMHQNESHELISGAVEFYTEPLSSTEEKSCKISDNKTDTRSPFLETEVSSAIDVFNFEDSTVSKNNLETIVLKPIYSEAEVNCAKKPNKDNTIRKNRRSRKNLECEEAIIKDKIADGPVGFVSDGANKESDVKCIETPLVESVVSVEDTANKVLEDSCTQPSVRYNRRSRKNINYNEEVLLNASESVSTKSVTEKKSKKTFDTSLNNQQNVTGEEDPTKDDTAPLMSINDEVESFKDDNTYSVEDSMHTAVQNRLDTDSRKPKQKAKPKKEKKNQNLTVNTIPEVPPSIQSLVQSTPTKDIFDFEEDISNESEDRKNTIATLKERKKTSQQIRGKDVNIAHVDVPQTRVTSQEVVSEFLKDTAEAVSEIKSDEKAKSAQMNIKDVDEVDSPPENSLKLDSTKLQKSCPERKNKKPKKNNMDIDIANILDSGNDLNNRRSPRKRKTLSEKKSNLPQENTVPNNSVQQDSPNEYLESNSVNKSEMPLNDNNFVFNKSLDESSKCDDDSPKTSVLETKSKFECENNFSLYTDMPENHSSDSNESLPLLKRMTDFHNKLAVKDNKCNTLAETTLPQDSSMNTKCVLDIVDSPKDSLPIISVSSTDDLFKTIDNSNPAIDDKLMSYHLDNLLPVKMADSIEDAIPDGKCGAMSTDSKKRKTKKKYSGRNLEQNEILTEEPKTNVDQPSYDLPERQYQLAKINIKNLLLSSLAPPNSTYMELQELPAEADDVNKNLEEKNDCGELSENIALNVPEPAVKSSKARVRKQKGKKSGQLLPVQDGFQIFDDAVQENTIIKQKNTKSILSKSLSFTTLKNVLSTFTKTGKKGSFPKPNSIFSDIPPLTEIITSSEMDIAPVLDEIDKSLESDDIYDFNEDLQSEINIRKPKSAKNKSKFRSKSCPKSAINKRLVKDSGRRTSNRSAKVKALENIHEKALTDSQDFELNIAPTAQLRKSRKRSKSLNATKEAEGVIPDEKESSVSDEKASIDKDSLFPFEKEVAEILNTPTEQYESDLLNEFEVINSLSNNISKSHPKSNEPIDFDIISQNLNKNMNSSEVGLLTDKTDCDQVDNDGLELRRSRRGSRKVASYNENDLIDPLIDALESRRSRSCRKDKSVEKSQVKNDTAKEAINDKPKLTSEELFDLLKNSSFEDKNVNNTKVHNSFFDSLTDHNSGVAYQDITDDDLDNVQERMSTQSTKVQDADKIYEFTEESPENTEEIKELFGKNKIKSKQRRISTEAKIMLELATSLENTASLELVDSICSENDPEKPNYCEICKKSFIRLENLIKHKTTLTHISKLSELEAKEAEERARLEKQTIEEQSDASLKPLDALRDEINITDILQQTERSQVSIQEDSPSLRNNHSLKLVDIISDVLNKPVLESYTNDKQDYSATDLQSKAKGDIRRYKSLGERKSFESENFSEINPALPASFLPPALSQTAILENQINLLENIIGTNMENITSNKKETENSFVDEISSCSIASNVSDLDNNSCATNKSVFNISSENIEANCEAVFNKPTQYEEISEDSASARVYEDPKQRKTLNRDEELFLECCSLLKSGSEVSNSNYSKKAKKPIDNVKELNEPELLDDKKLIQTAEEAHEYSDNSRTPTPLGDTYDDQASNSNTISSNWHLNSEKPLDKNRSFSFEEVKNKEAAGMTFGEILTKGLRNQFENTTKTSERSHLSVDDRRDDSDSSTASKKVATKGARKVFEGLKVSIPTEDLNLDVLNASPLNKKSEGKTADENSEQTRSKPRSTRKSKPVKKSQVGSNLLFKVNKKKSSTKVSNSGPVEKQDIYNFEDTQDNTDIFIKPIFKETKATNLDVKKDTLISDNESLGYADSIGADAKSVSSVSSISAMSLRKPEITPENITKKKYKIMGKIFKNAAKSKLDDIEEELRNIPEIPEMDNLELVENYVRSCQRVKSPFLPPPPPPPLDEVPKKPKMTEEEMNMLFDQLLGREVNETKPEKSANKSSATKAREEIKKTSDVKKKNGKVKNRKRLRGNSESSDDEFNIIKTAKKRSNKNNHEDSGINLELELKECIGVASRKSQRTCTSGKQNILVEYWSSDEEAFEAMLESHKIPAKKDDEKKKVEKKKTEIDVLPKKSADSEVFEKPLEKPAKPKPTKKKTQSIKKIKSSSTKESEISTAAVSTSNRRKRAAANPLYHWSSSSEDESQSLIEVKPIREEDDEDDRPIQHGWIVGDSPKKLVTMLALTKGKKTDIDSVKEQGKRRTSNAAS